MRTLSRALVTLALPCSLIAVPLAAQQAPEGWQMRADREGVDLAEVEFVDMAPGWHVTTGPAVILWHPDRTASGTYRVEMDVHLFDPEERREAFGLFVGGQDLAGDGQRYLYFLLRDGGEFLVKTRNGAETSNVVAWTAHEAIRGYASRDEGEASVQNTLAVEAHENELVFFVNGAEVARVPRAGLPVDGVVGLRVNHRLNLHVSRLEVSPLG